MEASLRARVTTASTPGSKTDRLHIAYVHYGEQSGVTPRITEALRGLGHRVTLIDASTTLALRRPNSRRLHLSPAVLAHLAVAVARYRRAALSYRWCTPFAFELQSRAVGAALYSLRDPPDLVLQNGALFAPGAPPPLPYALLLDHTRALGERAPAVPEAGLPAPPRWGEGWRQRERALYLGAAAIATFSENTAHSVRGDYGVAPERVQIVGMGPNIHPPRPAHAPEGETLLFVGREFERKGGPLLVKAFEQLRRRRPRLRLLVAGPTHPLGLPSGAAQLGDVPISALEALFARANAFALPTLVEPFGIAFLDAMACALPCIGTRVEAIPEIIEDRVTGLLVPPADLDALVRALEELLTSPERATRMGLLGRQRLEERFAWPHVAARLDGMLRAAFEASRSRSRTVVRTDAESARSSSCR